MKFYKKLQCNGQTLNEYIACPTGRIGKILKSKKIKWLSTDLTHNKYLRVEIRGVWKRVNRLIAETFFGHPGEGVWEAHHIDNDKSNNDISNLKWVDGKENVWCYWNEVMVNYRDDRMMEIFYLRSLNWTYKRIGAELNISSGSARNIYSGRRRPYLREAWLNQ